MAKRKEEENVDVCSFDELLSEISEIENESKTQRKTYCYMRVSTKGKKGGLTADEKQTFDRQISILRYSAIPVDKIFAEKVSGGTAAEKRPAFNDLLSVLNPGDTVIFTETSRMGRNYIDCITMIDTITTEKEANIRFLSNGFYLDGGKKLNPYQWLTISQFFIMDEFQKRVIGFNTKNGLKAKREQGVHIGRKVREDIFYVMKCLKFLRDNDYSIDEMVKMLGISKSTINYYISMLKGKTVFPGNFNTYDYDEWIKNADESGDLPDGFYTLYPLEYIYKLQHPDAVQD